MQHPITHDLRPIAERQAEEDAAAEVRLMLKALDPPFPFDATARSELAWFLRRRLDLILRQRQCQP
jgi:hypothetical protein